MLWRCIIQQVLFGQNNAIGSQRAMENREAYVLWRILVSDKCLLRKDQDYAYVVQKYRVRGSVKKLSVRGKKINMAFKMYAIKTQNISYHFILPSQPENIMMQSSVSIGNRCKGFPSERVSNAENVPKPWRHHVTAAFHHWMNTIGSMFALMLPRTERNAITGQTRSNLLSLDCWLRGHRPHDDRHFPLEKANTSISWSVISGQEDVSRNLMRSFIKYQSQGLFCKFYSSCE